MMQVMRVQRGFGAIGIGLWIGICLVVLILGGMGAARFFSDEHICLQRAIIEDEGNVLTVQVKVNVNAFNPPSSFLLEEQLPLGWTFIDSSAQPTTVKERTYSWFFWRGEGLLPIRDGVLSYRVRAHSVNAVTGTVVIRNMSTEKEYLRIPLGSETICA